MEINKKLGFKVVAVLTSASMILGGLAGCGKDASEDVAVVEQSAETDENDDLLSNVMNQVVHRSSTAGTEPRKDEVVYVMADAQGNTQMRMGIWYGMQRGVIFIIREPQISSFRLM